MITTITMNPALDKTIKVEEVAFGEVNRVGTFREDLGGKGINVGRILSGFGMPTMNLTFLGEDNQHEVIEYIKKDAMALDYVTVPGHTRTNIKIVETKKNRTTDMNEEGIAIQQAHYKIFMQKLEKTAEQSDFIVMGGSLAGGMPTKTYGNITRMYKKIAKVVIDADDEILMEGLKGEPYLIKPNIHELGKALNRELETDEEVLLAAREIINRYQVTYVLVSMGAKGSLLVSKEEAYRAGTVPIKIVSTVGAGDAMLAGFIYALSKNKPLDECLTFGAACSTLTISVEGYPRLNIDEVFVIARQVPIEKIKE